MKATLAGGALCLALGLGIGAIYARPAASPAALPASVGSSTNGLTRAELVDVVRQELARGRAADSPSAGPAQVVATTEAEPADARDALPPALGERAVRAEDIVDRALTHGVWTEADKGALTAQLDGLPGAVQAEIAAQLADAVNRGEIRIDVDDLPL